MSRWIDADHLRKWILSWWERTEPTSEFLKGGDILNQIDREPSIDIVRCVECKKLRDCRHDSWEKGVIDMGYVGWCEKTSRLGDVTYVKDSDFCSYGEREGE